MTWTYTQNPMTVPVDEVHFLVGDTDTLDRLVQDEEIAYYLALYPKPAGKPAYLAAAAVCDAIASQFARKADKSVGPLQISASQQYDHYVALAQQLRTAFATKGAGVIPSSTLRIHTGIPVLGGGGRTVLGTQTTRSGGIGTPA